MSKAKPLPEAVASLVRGSCIYDEGGLARVMAIADGYAMVRRPACAPFIVPLSHIDSERFMRWRTTPEPRESLCPRCGLRQSECDAQHALPDPEPFF